MKKSEANDASAPAASTSLTSKTLSPFGQIPEGTLCSVCARSKATRIWSEGMIAAVHGVYQYRCDVCTIAEQLLFARAAAARIAGLEAELEAAHDWDATIERCGLICYFAPHTAPDRVCERAVNHPPPCRSRTRSW